MAKDNPPLRLVGQRAASRRLESRKEIEEWLAERRRVLTALMEAERRGRDRPQAVRTPEQLTFDVEDAA